MVAHGASATCAYGCAWGSGGLYLSVLLRICNSCIRATLYCVDNRIKLSDEWYLLPIDNHCTCGLISIHTTSIPHVGKEGTYMILKRLSTNTTEVDLGNGTTVLFSYQTPVACHVAGDGYYSTEKKWSRTTSKHVSQWTSHHVTKWSGKEVNEVRIKPQEYFDGLVLSMQATNARGVC